METANTAEEKMKIGIMGIGRIAEVLAETMKRTPGVECFGAASRKLEKAQDFCRRHGFTKAYGSYEEMVSDPEIELVYIATPHSHHYENMKLCIGHGKPVLCEKSFTTNARQAREIMELAKKNKVYVAEAIWTRYMPSRSLINEAVSSGIIGDTKMMTATLWYDIDDKERIMDPSLSGGALLDVGVYAINFALMHFGKDISKIDSSVSMAGTGVDGMETMTVHFKDGKMASLTSGIFCRSDRKGIIYGEKGYIIVENINNPNSVKVFDSQDRLIKEYPVPEQISGYEYEILEAMDCIRKGETESRSMPLHETVEVMEIMDGIRKGWGLEYPGE